MRERRGVSGKPLNLRQNSPTREVDEGRGDGVRWSYQHLQVVRPIVA